MPDRVSARIAVAFAVVGLVAALTVSAGLFVALRTLQQEATIAAWATSPSRSSPVSGR